MEPNQSIIVCSWCNRIKGPDGYPLGPAPENQSDLSHGMCRDCLGEVNRQSREKTDGIVSKDDYLNAAKNAAVSWGNDLILNVRVSSGGAVSNKIIIWIVTKTRSAERSIIICHQFWSRMVALFGYIWPIGISIEIREDVLGKIRNWRHLSILRG